MFTRRNQLWWLIILSAATAASLYAIQGALVAPDGIENLPAWFWIVDIVLWSIRAMVESLVIIYLFSTTPQTFVQGVVLTIFEIALIGLITLTIGPALLSARTGLAVTTFLLGIPWEYGLAAYTSLMMGAAGYAYRVQPEDALNDELAELQAELEQAHADTQYAQAELARVQSEVQAARAAVQSASTFIALTPEQQVKWIADNRNGEGLPTNQDLAEIYGVHPATVGRWLKKEDGK